MVQQWCVKGPSASVRGYREAVGPHGPAPSFKGGHESRSRKVKCMMETVVLESESYCIVG